MLVISFKNRQRMLILGFVLMMGLSQIAVSIIGAGDADLAKHIFLYNVSFDLCVFILFSAGLARFSAARYKAAQEKHAAKNAQAVVA